jgi:hypothetical protein
VRVRAPLARLVLALLDAPDRDLRLVAVFAADAFCAVFSLWTEVVGMWRDLLFFL